MWGRRPAPLELLLVPALGERFDRWAVNIPWISRVKSSSCLDKGAMQFLICSSNSSWVRMRALDSLSVLPSWAPMMWLVSELLFSFFLVFVTVSYFLLFLKSRSVSMTGMKVMKTWISFRGTQIYFQEKLLIWWDFRTVCKLVNLAKATKSKRKQVKASESDQWDGANVSFRKSARFLESCPSINSKVKDCVRGFKSSDGGEFALRVVGFAWSRDQW